MIEAVSKFICALSRLLANQKTKRLFVSGLLTNLLLAVDAKASNIASDVVSIEGPNITLNGKQFTACGLESMAVTAPPAMRQGIALARYDHFVDPKTNFFDNAADWKANLIRFDLSQPGLDPSSKLFSKQYFDEIKYAVTACRRRGFVVMLSINDQFPSGDSVSHQLPTSATQRALLSLTTLFNGDEGVIYETFSEPQPWPKPESWKLWLEGGADPQGGEPIVGMQALVNAIRKTGAKNLIVVEGLNWGRTFKGAPAIHDPLNKMAYGVHPYYTDHYCQPADWDANFGFLAQQNKPIIATEWCATTGLKGSAKGCCKGQSSEQMTDEAKSFINYLQLEKLVWSPGASMQPELL